ncbi:hypothetical protein BDQ17DRAFT_1336832 [Cyathus striatus]|nr:hypothetical protein BDQ17DRAFT_1336832 [Cyathus striatus]
MSWIAFKSIQGTTEEVLKSIFNSNPLPKPLSSQYKEAHEGETETESNSEYPRTDSSRNPSQCEDSGAEEVISESAQRDKLDGNKSINLMDLDPLEYINEEVGDGTKEIQSAQTDKLDGTNTIVPMDLDALPSGSGQQKLGSHSLFRAWPFVILFLLLMASMTSAIGFSSVGPALLQVLIQSLIPELYGWARQFSVEE